MLDKACRYVLFGLCGVLEKIGISYQHVKVSIKIWISHTTIEKFKDLVILNPCSCMANELELSNCHPLHHPLGCLLSINDQLCSCTFTGLAPISKFATPDVRYVGGWGGSGV